MTHETFMAMALSEAEKGCGWVSPNPMVGAVIVKNGAVIGKGYHERFGGRHAEINALENCTENPRNATLYVTLEPCCHHGKTPPCTDAIIESGISDVVVGVLDPNALVSGKGLEALRCHGIRVVSGILEQACRTLNDVFFHFITTHTPYVVLKYAMTLDGKSSTRTGKSRWITGEEAREYVHRMRHRYMGIMTGVGTVIADDPMLSCRLPGHKNPVRIICDSSLSIPIDSKIVSSAVAIQTYIATSAPPSEKADQLIKKGIGLIAVSGQNGRLNLRELMQKLGALGLDSILLEGGPSLNAAALECGIVNRVCAFIAPTIFGGEAAKTPVGGSGVESPGDADLLKNGRVTALGRDFLFDYRLK
ncbi:bifunctional diaminohydroxyphosphoribosylaminopyrimidine deaminase/5-amino-6-(5-phosphoribosylamino)uracil reductase RibD [Oscillospiraceae bacterium WX1]